VNAHFLRIYDYNQAQKVDYFIANSDNVAKRVEKFYRKKVDKIIYPPVNVAKFRPLRGNPLKGDYYLTGGRMMASKNFDLIIKAFNELGLTIKIYGDGPLRGELEGLANENIEFLGEVNENKLVELYQNAKAFIVAQKDEDFGITPVEAMAAGAPIVAYRGGGYMESVIEGKTGVFFDKLTVDSLSEAIKRFDVSIHRSIKKEDLYKQAEKFSEKNFKRQIQGFVKKVKVR
jgi:glycosyltransferase involved in cell wall biosynthesis